MLLRKNTYLYTMNYVQTYDIAEWQIAICADREAVCDELLPSFSVFKTERSAYPLLMTMTVDQTLTEAKESQHVKVCETGNGDIVVDRLTTPDGLSMSGYQFQIKNLRGETCALMQSNADFTQCRCRVFGELQNRQFGLNNAMMMAFAFAGATHGTLLIHASLVRHDGFGYAFIAKSGTGKSTQTTNWLKVIPGCDLMNDDNPVLRVKDSEVWIYGSPWSGKTPCYRQVKAPIGAITKIDRAKENYVETLHPVMAFNHLLSSCSVMKWDKPTYSGICNTVTDVVEHLTLYVLHCTAEPESAKVCYEAIRHRN